MDSDPSWPTQPKMDWSILNPSLIYCQEWEQQFCLSSILPLYLLKYYKFSWWVKLVSRVRAYPPVQLDSSYVICQLPSSQISQFFAVILSVVWMSDDILRFGVWDWVCLSFAHGILPSVTFVRCFRNFWTIRSCCRCIWFSINIVKLETYNDIMYDIFKYQITNSYWHSSS